MLKICTKCKLEKSLDCFCKNNHFKDKLNNLCKDCQKEKWNEWYSKNKEQRKEYKLKNKEKIKQQNHNLHLKNKEERLEYSKNYYKLHKEEETIRKREWLLKNKYYYRDRARKLRITDIKFKLMGNIRSRFNRALHLNNKLGHAIELLGCSIGFFKKYLESQFKEGMNWSNYGLKGWHIDHIKPISSFDLSNPEEQKLCEHYTNKQPLWANDNLKKSNKI